MVELVHFVFCQHSAYNLSTIILYFLLFTWEFNSVSSIMKLQWEKIIMSVCKHPKQGPQAAKNAYSLVKMCVDTCVQTWLNLRISFLDYCLFYLRYCMTTVATDHVACLIFNIWRNYFNEKVYILVFGCDYEGVFFFFSYIASNCFMFHIK